MLGSNCKVACAAPVERLQVARSVILFLMLMKAGIYPIGEVDPGPETMDRRS